MTQSEKVKASLERIRAEALRKSRQAVAEKSLAKKPENFSVGEIVGKIRDGVNGPLAQKAAKQVSRKVLDKFVSIFEDKLNDLQTLVTQKVQMPAAVRNEDGDVFLYPDGCRFIHLSEWDHTHRFGCMVVEQPPQMRTILIQSSSYTQLHVPFPYIVFVLDFQQDAANKNFAYRSHSIGFNVKPLKTLDDHLFYPTLPNFSAHNVCMGRYSGIRTKSIADVAVDFIGNFWQSTFASQFPPFSVTMNKAKIDITTWGQWEQLNPLDMLNAKFNKGSVVRSLIPKGRLLNTTEKQQINKLIQETWAEIMNELNADAPAVLIQACSQEILNKLLAEF